MDNALLWSDTIERSYLQVVYCRVLSKSFISCISFSDVARQNVTRRLKMRRFSKNSVLRYGLKCKLIGSLVKLGFRQKTIHKHHRLEQVHTRRLEQVPQTRAGSHMERGSSAVECRTRNQVSPGSNPPLVPFRRLGIFVLSINAPVDSAV